VALTVLALLAGAGSATASGDPAPSGLDIRVTVAPGSGAVSNPAPAPSAPGAPSRTSTTTTVNGVTVVSDSQNPPVPEDDERSIGGVLYLSGLTTEHAPSLDPLGGELNAQFTIRNVSTASLDGTARFWLTGPIGAEISEVEPVHVTDLKPGESRVVDVVLPGTGQWTFETAHFTFTPPASVDGVALEPMTRDAFVILPPWFLIGLIVVGGVVYAVVRIRRASAPLIAAATGATNGVAPGVDASAGPIAAASTT
jgi:hypothetical protein